MQWLPKALVLTLFVAACSPGDDPAGPSATLDEQAADAETALEQEVEAAYLRSWEVYAAALRSLSTAGLEESFAGPALESTIAEVNRLKAAGSPVQMKVDHSYEIDTLSAEAASVTDRYRNHAVLVHPATGAPSEPDPNNTLTFIYELRKVDSLWRVTGVARQ